MTELLLMLAILVIGPLRPDVRLTPGVIRPLTRQAICATKWGRDRRRVTVAMKQHVAAAYGVPWSKRHLYEFDHLIPRSLGGADDERNLWPQPLDIATHVKDPLEVKLSRAVCRGQLSLEAAQETMRRWGR